MELSELKTGMVLETRRGSIYLVMNNYTSYVYPSIWKCLYPDKEIQEVDYLGPIAYNKDLTHFSSHDFDIVKVGRPIDPKWALNLPTPETHQLLWEREEPSVELTLEDIAKKFGVDVKCIKIVK